MYKTGSAFWHCPTDFQIGGTADFYNRLKASIGGCTKNNILIQSARAMLAQANQVPQGVFHLLG